MTFQTPILFLIWNRPDCVLHSFQRIVDVQPSELYIASDGPIQGDIHSTELVQKSRDLISNMISWPCNVHYRYLSTNVGCKEAVSSAITWFFENVEAGIIVEDDVVCDHSFFHYSSRLLHKYRGDHRIGSIGANCFNSHLTRHPQSSYSFSRHPHVWGWATWSYIWKQYDVSLKTFNPFSFAVVQLLRNGLRPALFWTYTLIKVKSGRINTWDYQLSYLFYTHGLLSVVPSVELVTNTGFASDASHTTSGKSPLSAPSTLRFPLIHPESICTSRRRDNMTLITNYFPSLQYIARRLLSIVTIT